jgi:hypothetical protein
MDFLNQLPVVGENILTTFKQKELILINVQMYDGPITMQYLPYGGIQCIIFGDSYTSCGGARQGKG